MKSLSDLSVPDHQALTRLHQQGATHRQRERAHAILLSAKGLSCTQIAHLLDTTAPTVSGWLARWNTRGAAGLADAPKRGRPRKLDEALVDDLMDILAHPSPNLKAALQADLQKKGTASAGPPSPAPSNGGDVPSAAPAMCRPKFLTPKQRRATTGR